MLRNLAVMLSSFLLIGCAYTLDTSLQDIEFVTPGTRDSICYVYIEGARYKVMPPQTINIYRSNQDLIADCYASGNRHKKVVIGATTNDTAALNSMTGFIPGMAFDYASKAMFEYPATVYVDFSDSIARGYAPPSYEDADAVNPDSVMLEEFSSSLPRLNADKDAVPAQLKKRELQQEPPLQYQTNTITEGGASAQDNKSNLKSIHPANSSSGAAAGPIPLYPGN